MNIRQQAKALYGAYSWTEFADLSEAKQFVESFSAKNWNVSIDGPFESDYGRYQAIVREIAEENCTLGFALSDLLKISSEELPDLASLARSFLDELLHELAVSVDYKESPDGQLNAYLYALEECASIASIANDLIESAIENGDQSNSSQIIRQIFDKFKSHEAVEAGLALASVALTMRLVKANQFNYCLVAAFSTVKLIGSLTGWKLGAEHSISIKNKQAADVRHGRAGGSRDKAGQIRELWASGKFSTREDCAEQESGALGITFGTARRHLRGTKDPDPWPAKGKK